MLIKKILKEFLSELYHFLISFLMKIPCGLLRVVSMHLLLKRMGTHSFFGRSIDVRCPYRIQVGSNSSINKRVLLDGRGGNLIIGDNVDIAQEVNIWTLQHDYNSPTYEPVGGEVVIEDYVWIASRATILPGVHIGRGAVVASCAVVTKDIPPMSIVGGVPAKVIGQRRVLGDYKLGRFFIF